MIKISDIQELLSSKVSSLGGLCLDPTINPWSKWKPILSKVDTLTEEELRLKNYGITILWDRTCSGLLNKVNENSNIGYIYEKPIGGPRGPFRLGDFRNYYHTAPHPIMSHYKDGDVEKINGVDSDYKIVLFGIESVDPKIDDDTNYLTKSHIYPEGIINRGAYITDGENYAWSVGEIPWGQPQWQKFKGKEVQVLEFLTNIEYGKSIVDHISQTTDRFYALPDPLHTITASNGTPSGSRDVFIEIGFTGGGIMFGGVGYDTVTYSFKFSSIGDVYRGGTLSNIWIGLYSDSDCINIITQKRLNSGNPLTIGNEEESQLFFGSLSNTTGEAIVYLGIFWNNKLQWKIVPMASPDLPDQIETE